MPQNAGRKGNQGKWGGRRASRLRGSLGTSVSGRAGMKLAPPAQAQALPGPTSRTAEGWLESWSLWRLHHCVHVQPPWESDRDPGESHFVADKIGVSLVQLAS